MKINNVLSNSERIDNKKNKIMENKELSVNSELIKMISDNSDDFQPILALVLVLDKLVNNFEKKNIISKGMSKPYALLSSTNKVQKDIINEIIAKQNDHKGQSKKMYLQIINNTLKAIKQNTDNENKNFLSRFRNRG